MFFIYFTLITYRIFYYENNLSNILVFEHKYITFEFKILYITKIQYMVERKFLKLKNFFLFYLFHSFLFPLNPNLFFNTFK